MELVRGVKITDYCDGAKLSTHERLGLFILVCQAVQHAHQKGIIHRDLKPSNVLVTVNDGMPVPKVIDFGIAKATTDQRLTDKTLFTAYEQFIGTPAYMSPEQAVMTSLDIDTRSDIYSFVQEKRARQRAVAAEHEQVRLRQEAERRAEMGQTLASAGLLLSQGRYDEAQALMSGVPPHPASSGIYNALGMLHVQRGNWREAVTNFARVVDLVPADHLAYHHLAPLLVHTGDLEAYRSHCRSIVSRFSQTTNVVIAERMAKDMIQPGQ